MQQVHEWNTFNVLWQSTFKSSNLGQSYLDTITIMATSSYMITMYIEKNAKNFFCKRLRFGQRGCRQKLGNNLELVGCNRSEKLLFSSNFQFCFCHHIAWRHHIAQHGYKMSSKLSPCSHYSQFLG